MESDPVDQFIVDELVWQHLSMSTTMSASLILRHLAVLIVAGFASAAIMPAAQYAALQDFYDSTNGSNWRWRPDDVKWNFTSGEDPCTAGWCGITCIPATHSVVEISLDEYRLTGSIPDSIGSFTELRQLDLEYNRLSGSIPPTIGQLTLLEDIWLNDNFLTGPIPSSIVTLTSVGQINFDFNRLTGSIPNDIGNMTSLVGMGLNDNRLTGTIPSSVESLRYMAGMRLHNNHLRGTIPSNLTNCTKLITLTLFNNSLTGTIPYNLGELQDLITVQLSTNRLTGTIPASFSTLSQLTVLAVDGNSLTGTTDGLFNATVQTVLNTIQLSDNQLSGTLPPEAFKLPLLLNFAAVGNCFHGSLPDNICDARQLVVLALDGLSSATSCQSALLPSLSSSYVVDRPVEGTVPSCLFAMSTLHTLHLSGNGFIGSLPSSLSISDGLVDLSLSHNQLTGAIPAAVQTKSWYNLDLSYNIFQGTLSSNFAAQEGRNMSGYELPATSLSLENNRISGLLPRAVLDSPSLSVLRGNLFSCKVDRSNLPQADDNVSNYQCGSQAFDAVYYAWLALLIAALALCAALSLKTHVGRFDELRSHLHLWHTAALNTEVIQGATTPQLNHVLSVLENVVIICAAVSVVLLVVFLPLYGLLKLAYSTHEHQYAWTVSVAFQTGAVAVGLEIAAFVLLLTGFVLFMRPMEDPTELTNQVETENKEKTSVCSYAVLTVYAITNTVVVVGVNIAFVYIALRGSSAAVSASQLAIAVFKMCWNDLSASGRMVTWLSRAIHPASAIDVRATHSQHTSFLMLAVALFNTLIIPCLVVLVISPDCFYNVFVPAPSVTSQYIVEQCTNVENGAVCLDYKPYPQKTTYNPPFKYSYQCSASFVTYYTPAFVYMCLIATFGTPLLQLSALWLQRRVPPTYRRVHWVIDQVVPRLLRPLPPQTSDNSATTHIPNPLIVASVGTAPPPKIFTVASNSTTAPSPGRFFNANRVLLSFLTYLGLLLTFGLAYPPLAACVVSAMVSMLIYLRLCMGRFVHGCADEHKMYLLRAVEDACSGVGGSEFMRSASWLLVVFSSCFYTLFMFDTLGDALGFDGAYWVLVVVPLVPVYIYLLERAYVIVERRSSSSDLAKEPGNSDVELQVVL